MPSPDKITLKGKAQPPITVIKDGKAVTFTPRAADIVLNKRPPALPFKPKSKANGYT